MIGTANINKYTDCTIYVVRVNYLEKRMLEFVNDIHKSKKIKNLAFLLNGVDVLNKSYGYGYGYGYVYGYGAQEEKVSKFEKIISAIKRFFKFSSTAKK